jgi:hypothetical protein
MTVRAMTNLGFQERASGRLISLEPRRQAAVWEFGRFLA